MSGLPPRSSVDAPGPEAGTSEFAPLGLAVLVVEDNPVNQKVAVRMLGKFGCESISAENGVAAIERFQERHFDLVLMDCEMPVMDGYTATVELRSRAVRCPILALTANGDRQRCSDVGMDGYLPKPYRPQQLYDALRSVLV